MESAITVEGLTKEYNGKLALHDLSVDVKRGEVFGYLGPNGAGKSMTIRILSGLTEQTSGGAFIGGLDIRRDRLEISSALRVLTWTGRNPCIRIQLVEFFHFINYNPLSCNSHKTH